jgi:hypothetical protein
MNLSHRPVAAAACRVAYADSAMYRCLSWRALVSPASRASQHVTESEWCALTVGFPPCHGRSTSSFLLVSKLHRLSACIQKQQGAGPKAAKQGQHRLCPRHTSQRPSSCFLCFASSSSSEVLALFSAACMSQRQKRRKLELGLFRCRAG